MINCPTCGIEFNEFTRGKPKTYCSDNCRDYFKYYNALEKTILAIEADTSHSKMIIGDMFRLANTFRNGTNSSSIKC